MSVIKEQLIELIHSGKIELIGTHEYLSLPVIERIYKKMTVNLLFGGIRVEKNVIIDGHHRYLASLLANYNLDQVPCIRSQAKKDIEWKAVQLVEEDWDTPSKIEMLNKEDAKYNGMSLEVLLEKIK